MRRFLCFLQHSNTPTAPFPPEERWVGSGEEEEAEEEVVFFPPLTLYSTFKRQQCSVKFSVCRQKLLSI